MLHFSYAKYYLIYFRNLNYKQVMENILHCTQPNTLPQSHCFANAQALGHHFHLSRYTQLRLSQRLIETLPSSSLSALI